MDRARSAKGARRGIRCPSTTCLLIAVLGALVWSSGCGSTDPGAEVDASVADARGGDASKRDGTSGDSALGDTGVASEAGSDAREAVDGGEVIDPCARCHGSAANAAPPVSLSGQSATTLRAVGAHQAHLTGGDWYAAITCEDCHLVPGDVGEPGHIDSELPAEVVFSERARAENVDAQWNGTTCTTYCHGASLTGGSATTPQWTLVDGSQTSCISCHGFPPGGDHPARDDCATCHGAVIDAQGNIIAPALHIDGEITAGSGHPAGYIAPSRHGADFLASPDGCGGACHGAELTGGTGPSCESCHAGWKTNCTFCHGGTDNTTGAPPVALDGSTQSTNSAVGAHSEHVEAGSTHAAWGCDLCHRDYDSALSAGHLSDGAGDLQFTGLAAGTSYDTGSATCSNVYCHGSGKPDATGSVVWTAAINDCDACHPRSQLGDKHRIHVAEGGIPDDEDDVPCNACHGTTSADDTEVQDTAKHVN
jgi:predicted CxxxxCH...CXXCH cytochrome family protein